ncbi:histidine kinase [Sungkyunkwania multivorans]|uniref:Histidine kinase n=1 Tax=Sungkyunkwania multivorans TaxID=1173618 RepID=A0ABW3CZ07_9FLAO
MKETLIFILIFTTMAVQAQIPGLTQFTIDNGLPSNTVYDVIQDEQGFIWLATDNGVSKFDGKSFSNYALEDGLPDNEILYFFKDSKQRIWLIAFNGKIGYYHNGRFHNADNTEFLGSLTFRQYVSDIYEDSRGNIWFYQFKDGVKTLANDNSVTSFDKIPLIHEKKGPYTCILFAEKKEGEVILTHQNIADLKKHDFEDYDIETNKLYTLNFKKDDQWGISENSTLRPNDASYLKEMYNVSYHERMNNPQYGSNPPYFIMSKFSNGTFWVTNCENGVNIYDPSAGLDRYQKILPDIRSSRSYEDREKNVWIGSLSSGVVFLPNQNITGYKNGTDNDLVSIYVDNDFIYTGSKTGTIEILKKISLEKVAQFKTSEIGAVNEIKAHANNVYFLSDNSIIALNSDRKPKEISRNELRPFIDFSVFKSIDFQNDFWYTANSYGILRIQRKDLSQEVIWNERGTNLHRANKDTLWIGTTNGLHYYDNDAVKKLSTETDFDRTTITEIDSYGNNLVFSSNTLGLGILNKNVLTSYNRQDGLLSNNIKFVHIDDHNHIWICSNTGINRLKLNADNSLESIVAYTISDGLYTNDVRSCYVFENKCYVATSSGLNIIDLNKEQHEILPPKVHINEFYLNNEKLDIDSTYTFSYDQKNMEFKFAGISFKSMGNISYEYKLDGIENSWLRTTSNVVRYSSLPPGNYKFKVKAIAKGQVESTRPACIAFRIAPPFYKRAWFVITCLILLISLLGIFIARRIQRQKNIERAKAKIASLKYQALMAQMNPHFIKNMLFNINAQLKQGDGTKAAESMDKFSKLINLVLKATRSNLISLNEEIDTLRLYIELQQIRLGNSFDYQIHTENIDERLLKKIHIPPMLLQPLIENSILHGLRNYEHGNLDILFTLTNDTLTCKICDKGILNEDSLASDADFTSSGISVQNIKERLALISDTNDSEDMFCIKTSIDFPGNKTGSLVTLKIPAIIF